MFTESRQAACHYRGSELLQRLALNEGLGLAESGRGYILGKANEILMIGVDVGELDVNQQHDLNSNKQSQK